MLLCDYAWFVINVQTGEILSGWEFKADAKDDAEEWRESTPVKVVARKNVSPPALADFAARNGLVIS